MNRAWWGHRLWQACCLPEALAFRLGQLERTQRQLLRAKLSQQAGTEYGKRHQLSRIDSYEEFRERVPLTSYEDLLPYLQTPNGLSTQPVKVWEPTGGSSGGSKWIPWTAELQKEFRRAVSVWIWHLLAQHPEVIRGRGYWQLTPKTQLEPPDWLTDQRHGFEKDSDYLGHLGSWLERSVLIVPPPGPHLWEQTADLLLRSPDLALISCWSPSFLTVLHERIVERRGRWSPQQWWPNLKVISCWTQGASQAYLPQIQKLFPQAVIQPKGLLSTEAVVTIPIQEQHPLAYRSHFFEFQTDDGTVIPSWQLQHGQEASVIVTTGSGFTRYQTADRVRVSGFFQQLPCLEFLGREGVVDHKGEKLKLSFLQQMLNGLEGFAMLSYEDDGYVLFRDDGQSAEKIRAEVRSIEAMLGANYSYADCRGLGQLKPLRGFVIHGDALAQYRQTVARLQKMDPALVKPQRFHPHQRWSHSFQGEFVK